MAHELPIVDPHQHLWDFTRQHYGWLMDDPLPPNPAGDCKTIARPYGLDDYLADVAGWNVIGTVHVDAGADAHQALDETRWLQETSDARGLPTGIVAYAALNQPLAGLDALLGAHRQSAAVRGIRQIVNWHADPARTYGPRDLLLDDNWRAGFSLLRKHDLSFDLQIYPSQMPEAARLAARHPDTRIILNHAGMPTDRDETGLAAWRDGMALLAAQPNVAVKISGLAMVDRSWTTESIRPFVLTTIDLFGSERTMFASNFPVDRLYGDFSQHYEAYDALTADFSDADRRNLFAGTATAIYRL
ncbi:amidohydrolase family protein [Brevundimonas variabilis]|uniref:Putative TIM-barrel fold metal-dependent hydrolase n=1 Tax=Brevundimonas variabilis TaxID=74312 RepID=A0A7W9CLJ8_9CAUL|nr:amidohydrolase family protein [Brevundimonas variabilis]MBB5747663.1 putative TIM-barrel fold metal-dependent hydrolase [Brevundimonas variabilis]